MSVANKLLNLRHLTLQSLLGLAVWGNGPDRIGIPGIKTKSGSRFFGLYSFKLCHMRVFIQHSILPLLLLAFARRSLFLMTRAAISGLSKPSSCGSYNRSTSHRFSPTASPLAAMPLFL